LSRAAQGVGRPLPPELQSDLEAQSGKDLGNVQVHTDAAAAEAAEAISARAYTSGQHIYFARSDYDPSSMEGRRLIAHEVAHTVQQDGSPQAAQAKRTTTEPTEPSELEADAFAEAFVSGDSLRAAQLTARSAAGIARAPAGGAGSSSKPQARKWDPPPGCPPAIPKAAHIDSVNTGTLGGTIAFLLREMGVGTSWAGWRQVEHLSLPVGWTSHLAGDATRTITPTAGSQLSVSAALARCDAVSANQPTFRGALAFEISVQVASDELSYGSDQGGDGAADTINERTITVETGEIQFTVPEGEVDKPASDDVVASFPATEQPTAGQPTGRAEPQQEPPVPMPAPVVAKPLHELSMAMLPDYSEEYEGLKDELERGLGRSLRPPEIDHLKQLTLQRYVELQRLHDHEAAIQEYDAEIAELEHKQYIMRLYDAGILKKPRHNYAWHFWHQFTGGDDGRQGIVGAGRILWGGFKHTVEESGRLREEAIKRGDYMGAAFTPLSTVVIESVEGIQDGLDLAQRAIEERLEAKSTREKAVADLRVLLGFGQAAMGVWGMVEPIGRLEEGGIGGAGIATAGATAGPGARAAVVASDARAVTAGSLSHQAIILGVAGLSGQSGRGRGGNPWKKRRTLEEGDTGLKDHARRHSDLDPEEYLRRGQDNIEHGRMLKGGGKHPDARYYVRKVGEDQYSVTITDQKGQILSIDTWQHGGTPMTRKTIELNLSKSGVTPPKGFWEKL